MMGSTKIDLSSVLTGGLATRKMYPLKPKGEIELEIKYQAEGFKRKDEAFRTNLLEELEIVPASQREDLVFTKSPTDSLVLKGGANSKGAIVTSVSGEAKEKKVKVGERIVEINSQNVEKMEFW